MFTLTPGKDEMVLREMESLLEKWCDEVEVLLFEGNQVRKEADDIGADAELAYWKSKMAKFEAYVVF